MRWPIRYQILVPFAGVLLAALATVSLLNAYFSARRSQQQIDQQLRHVAQTLAESNFRLTDTVLRQMHGLSGAEFMLVADDGRPLAVSRPLPDSLAMPEIIADRWNEVRLGPAVHVGGVDYFQSTVRLDGRGLESGPALLHILYPKQFVSEAQREAIVPPLGVGIVALLLCAAVAIALSRRLSRPIREVCRQVAMLADGDFRSLPLPERNDELRDLATSVNALAEQLDDLRDRIARGERLALLGQLSGGLAHHLRNDVTGAQMAVQMHQRHCQHADRESLDVALRQLALTEEHLKRFLAAGQPQAPQCGDCNLSSLLGELLALIAPLCRHRRVSVKMVDTSHQTVTDESHEAAGGPIVSQAAVIQADTDQLRQAITNLLFNAVEAAGPGGWMRVEISHEGPRNNEDSATIVRVIDSGPGFPAGMEDRLFEAFATTKPEGVGLGLAVARQIAKAHGGQLDYNRRDGATCFELTLPMGMLPLAVPSRKTQPPATGWPGTMTPGTQRSATVPLAKGAVQSPSDNRPLASDLPQALV